MEPETQAPAAPVKRGPVKRLLKRFRDTETGQALVEFTMILPIFLMLLFGLVEFGRAFYTWMLVTNAAREGARVAAVQEPQAVIQTRIYDSLCSNYPSDCSLDPGDLTWTNVGSANIQGPRGSAVVVELSYDFQYVTPLGTILGWFGDSLATPVITAHTSMRLE